MPRTSRDAESVRLVALTDQVVHVGVHLVLEDAVRGSARCPAGDEHAPAANIDPDGIILIAGSFAGRPAHRTAGSPLVLPAHRGRLQ
jgi:hypothetical protein